MTPATTGGDGRGRQMRDLSPYFDRDRRRDAQLRGYSLAIWDAVVIALRLPQIVAWLARHFPTDRKEQA